MALVVLTLKAYVILVIALTCAYLLRLRTSWPRRAALLLLLVLCGVFLPDVRAAVTALDPSWLAAVPFT